MSPTKPSTARYCSLLLEREALLNSVYFARPTPPLPGVWKAKLANLENALALATDSNELRQEWSARADESAQGLGPEHGLDTELVEQVVFALAGAVEVGDDR